MHETWFTADTHLNHKAILKFCNRPFNNLEEMEERIIENWNDVVKNGDIVYHLGDFAIASEHKTVEEYLKRLKGQKHLISGNHDHQATKQAKGFAHITPYKEIKLDKRKIILFHYAMRTWHGMYSGSWQLHGHSHGGLFDDPSLKQLDVGVDSWDFMPINYDQISKAMDNYEMVDHSVRRIKCCQAAVEGEREACAKIASTHINHVHYMGAATADSIAEMIRSRGKQCN